LVLPLKSIMEQYKVGKVKFALMLQNSTDPAGRDVAPTIKTGRKWQVRRAAEEAQSILQQKEVTGCTQTNQRGFNRAGGQWWST
jgi:hypothetical protein